MKIRNIDVEFDFFDADDMERFEREAKIVKEKCAQRNCKHEYVTSNKRRM